MKATRTLLRTLGILATVGALAGTAVAEDYYIPPAFGGTVFIGGEGAAKPHEVFGKEYSHTNWSRVVDSGGDPNLVNMEDHDAAAFPDPGQNVSWDGMIGPIGGNSGSTDAFDYPLHMIDGSSDQVDGIANHGDFLFDRVVGNSASLLFSVTADLGVGSVVPGGPVFAKAHVHYEDPAGGDGVWAEIEAPPAGPGIGPGVNHHVVEDVDGLEIWGPEPPPHTSPENDPVDEGYVGGVNTADANRFSLDLDITTGFSVFAYDITLKTAVGYIPHFVIADAVELLFLAGEAEYGENTVPLIDLDAMMVRDRGIVGEWDPGDELLFSIDPIPFPTDDAGGPLPAIDGGEIIHLVNTAAAGPVPSFLFHGGHLWNTAFDVAETFGYHYEDVDALEAVGTLDGNEIPYPEPTSLTLLAMGLIALPLRRRR